MGWLEAQGASRSLLPFKVGFFAVYASLGILSAYLILYLKNFGLNPSAIGAVLFCRPLGRFLTGLVCPWLTRKYIHQNKFMVFCALLLLFSAITALLIPLPTQAGQWLQNRRSNITNGTVDEASILLSGHNIFSAYLLILCVLTFCMEVATISCDTLQHGTAIRLLGEHNAKSYGYIRAWGALGCGIAAIATGGLITVTSGGVDKSDDTTSGGNYRYMFYPLVLSASVLFGTTIFIFRMDERQFAENRRKQFSGSSIRAISSVRNLPWLMVVVSRSVFFAITQSFLNWHLENIGASPLLIGTAVLVSTTSECVMFMITPKLLERFGEATLAGIGMSSYVARFLICSYLTNPVYVLPLEVVEGVMFACTWSAVMAFLVSQVGEENTSEIQGCLQTLSSVGMGISFIASGALIQAYGAAVMFEVFAFVALIISILFNTAILIPKIQCRHQNLYV